MSAPDGLTTTQSFDELVHGTKTTVTVPDQETRVTTASIDAVGWTLENATGATDSPRAPCGELDVH